MSPELQHELELARLSTDLKRELAQRSLATKTLEVLLVTKFVYEYGFQNGRLVAERIVTDILETIQRYWVPAADVQEPGSFTALAVSKNAVPGPYPLLLEETPLVPVHLRLLTEDERRRLAAGALHVGRLRRERALRFFFEAEEQGGLLTLADVAWFVGASPRSVGAWVSEHQRTTHQVVPTRGTLHDIGRGTTHKRMVVQLYLQGKLPSEVARLSRHAQKNVDRYSAGFERVRLLARSHPPEVIPALAGMSQALVREYLHLIEDLTYPETTSAATEGPRTPLPPFDPARSEIAPYPISSKPTDS